MSFAIVCGKYRPFRRNVFLITMHYYQIDSDAMAGECTKRYHGFLGMDGGDHDGYSRIDFFVTEVGDLVVSRDIWRCGEEFECHAFLFGIL